MVFLFACLSARAEVAVLGKGWLLDSAGSIVSTPAEVIAGKHSIKGMYLGPASNTTWKFLKTDPRFIRFTPNDTYTITFRYRILAASSSGFNFGFSSPQAERQGLFLPTSVITGATGASGTATLTSRLDPYTDVRAEFAVVGEGAIVIDDIRITNGAEKVLVMEGAEGPTIVPGPLRFQLTDAIALAPDARANARSAAAKDLDGDGYAETILTLTAPRPSTTPLQPIVIEASGRMRIATSDFFPNGAPAVKHSPVTLFADIDSDGRSDILFAEAGEDAPPFQGSGIGVALNLGGGKYRDVSSLVPAELQATRSYALAAGDIDHNGQVKIVLPDQSRGTKTATLRWNGSGFDADRNWISPSLWLGQSLSFQTWMVLDDFDKDGRQDLLVSGARWTPNLRILFGGAEGFSAAGLLELPDGPFGRAPHESNAPVTQGADVGPVVAADLNNDGLPDIFATDEQQFTYLPGAITDTNEFDYEDIRANGGTVTADSALQVFINRGARNFSDNAWASTVQNLGRVYYFSMVPVDLNNDGFLDIVGLYVTKPYGQVLGTQWGTTLFLNDGTGAFQVVDGAQLLAAATTTPSNGQQWSLGAFVPTMVNPQRTEGVVFESVGGCGLGFCATEGLNLYKVVAAGAIGTGPKFTDPAARGVPGFNEFYYLRHYADAAAAVQAGQYADGLAHYLAVGRAKGYLSRALNPSSPGSPVSTTALVRNSASGQPMPLAPESLVDLYGDNLVTQFFQDDNFPTELGGLKIDVVDGAGVSRPAGIRLTIPNLYGTLDRVQFLIPATNAYGPATLRLSNANGQGLVEIVLAGVGPSLFAANEGGAGPAAAAYQLFNNVPAQIDAGITFTPAAAGSRQNLPLQLGAATDGLYVSFYGTGFRHTTSMTCRVGGVSVPAIGAVAQSQYPGLDQAVCGPFPRTLAGKADVNAELSFDGRAANVVTLSFAAQ